MARATKKETDIKEEVTEIKEETEQAEEAEEVKPETKKQKKYKVIEDFRDEQDILYLYKVGKEYPREGYEPTAERIKEVIKAGVIEE